MSELVPRLLDAVADDRSDICDEILGLAIVALSPRDAVRFVLAPALVAAGSRWHDGIFSVAQEHLLTASVERLVMMMIMHTLQKAARGPGMLFGTLAGERHAVGSLLAACLAASQGMRCVYLGADLPPPELATAAVRGNTVVVALGVVTAVPQLRIQISSVASLPPASKSGLAVQPLEISIHPDYLRSRASMTSSDGQKY